MRLLAPVAWSVVLLGSLASGSPAVAQSEVNPKRDLLVYSDAPDPAGPPYRVLAQDRGHLAIVGTDGQVEWEVPIKHNAHDLQVLPNRNILVATSSTTVVEMTRDKREVWKYEAKPAGTNPGRVEIHAFERLPDGRTMVVESGNRRIVEVEADGTIARVVPLVVEHPDPHRDTRRARKLANGHYLVCHEGDGTVREYDEAGAVVWSYALDLAGRPRTGGHDGHGVEVYNALRMPSGNTLIAGGNNNRVIEVNPAGQVVWSVDHDELPGIELRWVTTLMLKPNGNVVFGNTHAGPKNPQLIEVTRNKQVVWTFGDFKTFGNDAASAVLLNAGEGVIR